MLAEPVAGETLTPLAALLEVKLSADTRIRLVEREAIQKVLGEQELQALFGATDAAKRISVGELIKADLLVLLRTARQEPGAKAVDVVVCETRAGLRLRVETLSGLEKPEAGVAGLQAIVDEALAKYASAARYVIAVPPFVSKDFLHSHDELKRRCARYAQQSLDTWPEVVLVELEEAEAIAQELAVAGKERSVDRQLPLYLMGEYHTTEKDGQLRVSMQLMVRQGTRTLVQRSGDAIAEDGLQAFLVDAARRMVAEVAGGSSSQHDPVTEAAQLMKRARVFMETAHWEEAMDLVEAAALLQPDDLAIRELAIDLTARITELLVPFVRGGRPSPGTGANQKSDVYVAGANRALKCARRGMVHTEEWIRRKDLRARPKFSDDVWIVRTFNSLDKWRYSEARGPIEEDAREQFVELQTLCREMLLRMLTAKVNDRVIVDDALGGFERALVLSFDNVWRMRFVNAIQDIPDAQDRIVSILVSGLPHTQGKDDSYHVGYDDSARSLLTPVTQQQVDELAKMPGRSAQRAAKILRRMIAEVPGYWAKRERDRLDRSLREMEGTKGTTWVFRRENGGQVVLRQVPKGAIPPSPSRPEIRDRTSAPPADVLLEPLELAMKGGREELLDSIDGRVLGWMPCGEDIDFAWTSRAIMLMKRPGRLEVVFSSGESVFLEQRGWPGPQVIEPFYDGQYIWAAVRYAAKPHVIAIDPRSSEVIPLTEKEGLPPMTHGLQLASIGPGKVCVAAAFGQVSTAPHLFDRSWCGLVSLDAGKKAAVDMLVEASRQRLWTDAQRKGTRIGDVFLPTDLVVLPDKEGGPATRVIILRNNAQSAMTGLAVDLRTREISPLGWPSGLGLVKERLCFDGRIYFASLSDPITHARVWEIALPDCRPEDVSLPLSRGVPTQDQAPILMHMLGRSSMAAQGEYIHVLRHGSREWWVGRCPTSRAYPLRVAWPWPLSEDQSDFWIRPSHHYGIVVSGFGELYRARIRPESLASVESRLASDASECRREHADEEQTRRELRQRVSQNMKAPLSTEGDEPLVSRDEWLMLAGILAGGMAVMAFIRRHRSRRAGAQRRNNDTTTDA